MLPRVWDWRPSPAESIRPHCRPAWLRAVAHRQVTSEDGFIRQTPDPESDLCLDGTLLRLFAWIEDLFANYANVNI
jgi:hypothetical protein